MRVADYVIRELEKHTKHIFCLVGGGSMHLNDALYGSSITPIFMLHEQGASFAAMSYAQMTGFGVCMVTSGPGATNAITGCLAAWMDSAPVLFISGNVPTWNMAKNGERYVGPQECDIISMVTGITKYNEQIRQISEVKQFLADAITEATTPRMGSVWLDIPLDIQGAEIE
ncbi:MAG: thiamine pyrophosphate-binding protein [Candidatus Paceibacterota bacterium]